MNAFPDLRETLLGAWRTSSLITTNLVENLPAPLWDLPVPGSPQRTVRMLAGHFHNSRSGWIRTLGEPQGITVPARVDLRKVTRRQLVSALGRSSKGIEALLELGIAAGGEVPATRAYVWRNLPLDVGHVLAYFVAHEGHHRGQIVMLARHLGHRLPRQVTDGLWGWTAVVRQWSPKSRRREH